MWNISVLEVLSKEEEETSKLDAFNYVQQLVICNNKVDEMPVKGGE